MAEGGNNLISTDSVCPLCNEGVDELTKTITPCHHVFHKSCLTIWLRDSNSCPSCLQTVDRRSTVSFYDLVNPPNNTNRPNGAVNIHVTGPTTRSRTAGKPGLSNVVHNHQTPYFKKRKRNQAQFSNRTSDVELDVPVIQNMIETSIQKSQEQSMRAIGDLITESIRNNLANLNRTNSQDSVKTPSSRQPRVPDWPNEMPSLANTPMNSRQSGEQRNSGGVYAHNSDSQVSSRMCDSEKIIRTISNWKLSFDGSVETLTVEEFIYRVNTLTKSSLRGDFTSLTQQAHLLFQGKALNWFWRFHKTTPNFDWCDLCENLKANFHDIRTDYDIKETIRSRKQKSGEKFEKFLDSILVLNDALKIPLPERELVEILKRNLLTNIRIALLHLNIEKLSELRSACHKHESFYESVVEPVRLQRATPNFNRRIAELGVENNEVISEVIENCEIHQSGTKDEVEEKRCWNCDSSDHSYKLCTQPKRVFCYGCGNVGFFFRNCPKCHNQGNYQTDASTNNTRHPKVRK